MASWDENGGYLARLRRPIQLKLMAGSPKFPPFVIASGAKQSMGYHRKEWIASPLRSSQ
jgi:hypothetical protein